MPVHTLLPLAFSASPNFLGQPLSYYLSQFVATGDSDPGVCMRGLTDGKTLVTGLIPAGAVQDAGSVVFYFEDDLVIPLGAGINSVQFVLHHSANSTFNPGFGIWASDIPFIDPTLAVATTPVLTVHPITGFAWLRSQLFPGPGTAPYEAWNLHLATTNDSANPGGFTHIVDQLEMVVDYGPVAPLLWFYNTVTDHYKKATESPGPDWIDVDATPPSPVLTSVTAGTGT